METNFHFIFQDTNATERQTPQRAPKRPFKDIEPTEEISLVLQGRSVERNLHIAISTDTEEGQKMPKIGHIAG